MLDFSHTEYDAVAPFGDLLFKNACELQMDGITDGIVVAKVVIAGVV